MLRVVAVLLVCASVSGCGVFVAPSPTPREMDDVIAALVVRGVTVQDLTSGDAGCPGSTLHSNGVHFAVSLAGDPTPFDVYLLRWKDAASYTAAATDYIDCLSAYADAHPGSNISGLEISPWRAYGPDWTHDLRSTLDAAIRSVGGS